jgi:hypothetical protein
MSEPSERLEEKHVKILRSSSEVVLQTMKHTMIYLGSGLSLEVIALRPMVLY